MMRTFFWAAICVACTACIGLEPADTQRFEGVAPGAWRTELTIMHLDSTVIPATLLVKNTENKQPVQFVFQNGSSETVSDRVEMGRDTIRAFFGENILELRYEASMMEGYWRTSERYPYKLLLDHNEGYRFYPKEHADAKNWTGTWDLDLAVEDSILSGKLIIEPFENRIEAKLQLENQVYIHLEGAVRDGKLFLSFFDGEQFVYLEGRREGDKIINGGLLRYTKAPMTWEGRRTAQ